MIYITAIRTAPPNTRPAHIARVKWLSCANGKTGEASTTAMVEHIQKNHNVRVGGPDGPVDVEVVRPTSGTPYIRTQPDETKSDNLLELPRF